MVYKRNRGKGRKNIVTISNVRKTLIRGIEGLSEEEKSDFDLICSYFYFPKNNGKNGNHELMIFVA